MDGHDFDITYTAGGPLGKTPQPDERPPVAVRRIPEWLMHLRDDQLDQVEFRLHGTVTGRLPAPEPAWKHGVPPLRPRSGAPVRASRGGRRYPRIFLAEDEYYAGDVALHFERDSGMGDIISLTMTDLLSLQAAVTDPEKPVSRRQVREYLRALLASSGPMRDGWDPDTAAALHRVLALLEEG